jgi:hypothetical protein
VKWSPSYVDSSQAPASSPPPPAPRVTRGQEAQTNATHCEHRHCVGGTNGISARYAVRFFVSVAFCAFLTLSSFCCCDLFFARVVCSLAFLFDLASVTRSPTLDIWLSHLTHSFYHSHSPCSPPILPFLRRPSAPKCKPR